MSHAVSVVTIGGWKADGSPVATITSAVCEECGEWADRILVSGSGQIIPEMPMTDVRARRQSQIVAYACAHHEEIVTNRLVDEYGWCTNQYEPDRLARAVEQRGAGR